MDTQTQTQDIGQQLQNAVLQAAVDDAVQTDSMGCKKENENSSHLFKEGQSGNPAGRPRGAVNKTTKTIREAVEKAARDCHPDGLAGWLIERAQGSIQDRQIFAAMVNKAMPLQVQANVDGGIKLELSWLSGRKIGTTSEQLAEKRTQVIDLQQDATGEYRIADQMHTPAAPADAGGQGAGGADSEG